MKFIKDIRKNTFILITITFIVIYVVLKDNFKNILDLLTTVDIKYIVLCFFLFFVSIFFKAYASYVTVNDKQKYSLKESVKHSIIIQFFNGITPFSTGGQPMEIYMLTKHGISANKGTMIVLQNFIFYQIALVLLGILAVSYNYFFHIFPNIVVLKKFVLLGFFVNIVVAISIFIISISKKITFLCMNLIINILAKIKLIKNEIEVKQNLSKRLDEFHESAKVLRRRKGLLFKGVLLNFLSLVFLYVIPLFIVYSMGNYNSLSLFECLTSSAYVFLIGAFIPIPGASGGIEYGFLTFFSNFLTSSVNSAVMLIWRFITYYFGMIIGVIAFDFDEREIKK